MCAPWFNRPTISLAKRGPEQLGICLALLFGGIWLSDEAALSLLNPPGGSLSTRLASLFWYMLAFAFIVWPSARRIRSRSAQNQKIGSRQRKPFSLHTLILAGWLSLASGSILVFIPHETSPFGSLLALFLLKGIGAPVTIALVGLFSHLSPDRTMRSATLGIVGAFTTTDIVSLTWESASSPHVVFSMGIALLTIASWICASACDPRSSLIDQIRREETEDPLRESAITPYLAIEIIVTALILGFLQWGYPLSPETGVISGALLLGVFIIVVFVIRRRISVRWLLGGAVAFTAAGFLFRPLLSPVFLVPAEIALSVGSIFCEAFIWVMAVQIARTSSNALKGATAARLLIVSGHLLGTLIALTADTVSLVVPQAYDAVSFVVVFAFVLMLLLLINNPEKDRQPRPASVSKELQPPDKVSHRWIAPEKEPCARLAGRFGLTPRETEVLEQLAQGRDLAYMEEKFVLSRNTLKMHIKHVYAKLDVHGKQEVINLVIATRDEIE